MRGWHIACLLLLPIGCGAPPKPVVTTAEERPVLAEAVAQPEAVRADAAAPSAEQFEAAEGGLEQGVGAANSGDRGAARLRFEAARDAAPSMPRPHYNLGVLAEWSGQRVEAERHYRAALKAQPTFGPAVIALGSLAIRGGRSADAIRIAEGQLALAPKDLSLRDALNRVRVGAGVDNALVVQESKQVLREDEKNVPAMISLAAAFHQQRKFELAIAILENARELDPQNPEIFARRAAAQAGLGEAVAARVTLEAAVALPGGGTAESHNNLGLIYHIAGDYAGAEAQFRKALERWPEMLPAQINLGNALKGQQRYPEANQSLQRALVLQPESADAYYNLGVLFLDGEIPDIEPIERLEQALKYFKEYKAFAGARSAEDPVDQYIAAAEKRIIVERKRAEQMRRQPKTPDPEPEPEAEPEDAGEMPSDEGAVSTPDPEAGSSDAEAASVGDPGVVGGAEPVAPSDEAFEAEPEGPASAAEEPATGDFEDGGEQ